jgi:hypothetical protein
MPERSGEAVIGVRAVSLRCLDTIGMIGNASANDG